MTGAPGSVPVSIFAYPGYFTLNPGDVVNTTAIDFNSVALIGQDLIASAVEQWVPSIMANGEEILAYGLFQSTSFDIGIPQQICVLGQCWTPPFAGQNVASMFNYNLVIYTRSAPPPVSASYRPFIGIDDAVAIIILIIVVAGVALAIYGARQGQLTFQQAENAIKDIITAPGQAVSAALTGPLIGFGLVLVGLAIAVPMLSTRATVGIPVGGGHVELGSEFGRAPAPPPRPPARR